MGETGLTDDLSKRIREGLTRAPIDVRGAVVFGSRVRGSATADSDIDLLVVAKDIPRRRHRRGNEVAAIKLALGLGVPVDVLLLTEDEFHSNVSNHNPVFLEIAFEGEVIIDGDARISEMLREARDYVLASGVRRVEGGWEFPVEHRKATALSEVRNEDFARAWLGDAERDLQAAHLLGREGLHEKSVYHAQQTVEKSLKAVLVCLGLFRKTHAVAEVLREKLTSEGIAPEWQEPLAEAVRAALTIEPEFTWSRYPGIEDGAVWVPQEAYDSFDSGEASTKAERVLEIAKEFVAWWFDGPGGGA
ncbi:MAG: HEPN domain-containing protein [Nitrospirae bacterium]|nr:HEPN domain-containing protein [Nitrospirota bacterium]